MMSSDPSRGTPEAFDRRAFLRRPDHDAELVRTLVEVFDDDRGRLLGDIERAVAERDPSSLDRAAHTIKGALGVFAAQRAWELAERLEMMGRGGGVTDAGALLSELQEEVGRVVDGLHALVKEMESTP